MLKPGNRKLGKLIHHWSIPSGLPEICVGATAICLFLCYAMRHHYCRSNVKKSLQKSFELAVRKDFASLMTAWVRSMFARIVRVHASGEFFSAEYVQQWISVVEANPKVTFFAYTRSWRVAELLHLLEQLAALPNFYMWWSCDKDSGPPPDTLGVRKAYMMSDYTDVPVFDVDLVFRAKTKKVSKWVADALVCPAENGITKTTCSQCQICFRDKSVPKRRILEDCLTVLT